MGTREVTCFPAFLAGGSLRVFAGRQVALRRWLLGDGEMPSQSMPALEPTKVSGSGWLLAEDRS